jgi:hypothetical protein
MMAEIDMRVRGLTFVTDSWGRLPIRSLYDVDGEPTDDPQEAVQLVAVFPDGHLLVATCEPSKITRNGCN